MKSWKTTLGGSITALGGALLGAGELGWIKEEHRYPIKLLGLLATILGPFMIGIFARDNDKSSEEVGAKKPGISPLLPAILAVSLLAVACSGPGRNAYIASSATHATVEQAMFAWGDYVKQFKPPVEAELKVKMAFEQYQKCMITAINEQQAYFRMLREAGTNAPPASERVRVTSRAVSDALFRLVETLRTYGVKI